jgi:hypothetical protein
MLFARKRRFQVREETSLPITPMDNSLLVEDQRLCPTDIPSRWTWSSCKQPQADHERHAPHWVARCGAREFLGKSFQGVEAVICGSRSGKTWHRILLVRGWVPRIIPVVPCENEGRVKISKPILWRRECLLQSSHQTRSLNSNCWSVVMRLVL